MSYVCMLLLFLTLQHFTEQITYLCNTKALCGCSSQPAVMSKIVGGEDAAPNSWGWTVSLYINESSLCGGTILSSSWVLTAAHCVIAQQPSTVIISAASNLLSATNQVSYASSVLVHPGYNPNTMENDIALLKVLRPFNMSDPSIAQICLPAATNEDYPHINSTLVAVGWGTTSEDGNISYSLQQVTLQRIPLSSSICYPLINNSAEQMCAGVYGGGKDTCQGDSGGPLMMFTASRQWEIVGITSYGHGCARANYSGVYTRVIYYLDWIRSMNVLDTITVSTSQANKIAGAALNAEYIFVLTALLTFYFASFICLNQRPKVVNYTSNDF